jgi:hypothetical protein
MIAAIEWLGSATVKTHVRIGNGVEVNVAPGDVAPITGPTDVILGTEAQFESSASDADHDSLYYQWDIQGPTQYTSDWVGPYEESENHTWSYQFPAVGEYAVTVRAKEIWGNITAWSDPVTVSVRCCETRGDINHSGAAPDISDLVYLVTYMFQQGPPPPCAEDADINGSGAGPDISDLVYLVTYMFQSGPEPASCTP